MNKEMVDYFIDRLLAERQARHDAEIASLDEQLIIERKLNADTQSRVSDLRTQNERLRNRVDDQASRLSAMEGEIVGLESTVATCRDEARAVRERLVEATAKAARVDALAEENKVLRRIVQSLGTQSQIAEIEAARTQLYDVVLKEIGPNKVNVIKAIRKITGLGLKDTKSLMESTPVVLVSAVSREEAEKLFAAIEATSGCAGISEMQVSEHPDF